MGFYEELDTKVNVIKNDAAKYGRQIQEGGFSAPFLSKLQNNAKINASKFANFFNSVINTDYVKFQAMESDITVSKYDLDSKAKELCMAKNDQEKEQYFLEKRILKADDTIDSLAQKIKSDENSMKEIEDQFSQAETEGDLYRLPMWIFLVIMSIVGIAELMIYKSVFLSQEIGVMADLETASERAMVGYMAMVMAIGFIFMITWLAHETGKRLRHIQGLSKVFRNKQWVMIVFINTIVLTALLSTVLLRSDMHRIQAKDAKIAAINDASESGGLSLDEDDEDEIEDEESGEAQILKDEITESKAVDSWFFATINAFIYLGGVMLAYHTHTSSVRYEHMETLVARQRKRKEVLEDKKNNMLAHLKNDNTELENGFFKKFFSKKEVFDKRETTRVDQCEKILIKSLHTYTTNINTYEALSEEIAAKANALKNSYIDAVHSYLYELSNYTTLEDTIYNDLSFQDAYLEEVIIKVAKLDKYLQLSQSVTDEVIHINNIYEFIESINCNKKTEEKAA